MLPNPISIFRCIQSTETTPQKILPGRERVANARSVKPLDTIEQVIKKCLTTKRVDMIGFIAKRYCLGCSRSASSRPNSSGTRVNRIPPRLDLRGHLYCSDYMADDLEEGNEQISAVR